MKNLKVNNLLIVSSLLVLACYSIMVIVESFSGTKISMINLSSIFGNVIVTTIFIIDKAAAKDFKVLKPMLYLLRFLIICSVIFSGILFNELVNIGFLSGNELFWQLSTIILALGSIVLIQMTQHTRFNSWF